MDEQANKTVRVIVKLRDLDTDARSVFEHDVAPPGDLGEQRARLMEAVAEHKPAAEIRSFAKSRRKLRRQRAPGCCVLRKPS
jgi:hypothetical protein